MRQVVPSGDFPSNVTPIKFSPPEELAEEVGEAVGVAHRNPDDMEEIVALEFMLELTEDEIHVLKHEPYITLTIMSDHLHPFAIQTSWPPDEKYKSLNEHTHCCRQNLTHEKERWWKCDNPRHGEDSQVRECETCWRQRTQGDDPEVADTP